MPFVAAAVLAGGNVRVGLEDNLWLDKGVLATNQTLVQRAVTIVEAMGSTIMTPQEVREKLGLANALQDDYAGSRDWRWRYRRRMGRPIPANGP